MKPFTSQVPFGKLFLGLLALTSSPLPGQQADAGTLVIREGGRDIGAETFRLAPDGGGSKITSRVSYSGTPPLLTVEVTLVQHPGEVAFQLDRRRGATVGQVYAVQRRNRVTVRRVDRGAEEATELPGSADLVLLADSLFGPLLQLIPHATTEPRSVSALYPESGRRISFFVARHPATGQRGEIIRLSGGLEGEIQLGNGGEVLHISLPALKLEAHRSTK